MKTTVELNQNNYETALKEIQILRETSKWKVQRCLAENLINNKCNYKLKFYIVLKWSLTDKSNVQSSAIRKMAELMYL